MFLLRSNRLLLSGAAFSAASLLTEQELRNKGENILKYGEVKSGREVRFRDNYCLSYNQSTRTPIWVAESISKETVTGSASRKGCHFRRDPEIPLQFSATDKDYRGSGFSRGHMAPAADSKYNQEALKNTFYFSNCVPQNIHNNNIFWNMLEIFCRDLCQKYSEVRIVSGPLWLPNETDGLGKRYIRYEVIGQNNVHVPTHLYKVILAENDSNFVCGAFIVPNDPIEGLDLKSYQESLENVEKISGLTFFPKANRDAFQNLCTVENCTLKPLNYPNQQEEPSKRRLRS